MLHNSDPSDAPWNLLARHLAAEATPAERLALREWVQADPTHLQILTTVTRAWERAGEAATAPVLFSPADVEAAWLRLRPLVDAHPLAAARVSEQAPVPVVRLPWATRHRASRWQLAAGLVLLLGVGYAAARTWLFRLPQTVVTYTNTDQRQQVRLPDGSTVWLNARSRLQYMGREGASAQGVRAVQLTGEAYFNVVPDPIRPFVVNTTAARVRVIGTAFNVRAYAAEDSVEVSVTHGQVWLTHLIVPDSVLLTAGTRAALRAADAPGRVSARLRSSPAADPNFRAWQSDTLRFADASVTQVTRTLHAMFGTDVLLGSPDLGQCRFTGTFVRPQPSQVLAVLAAATASRLSSNGHGGYQLQGPGCTLPTPASHASQASDAESTPRAPRP
ncbi:FecR family protein [Hymenobacter sp. GOD-10R]|uniref:FecR family protein n=1 Tax=Hymenobacter sp. GOD-10R TaxID=3093922 RepID=UPI002D76D52D|nr:FecR domain-containing protein [Hymenobacter sp. GOD-10R]WRQ31705.1 FecR domain-containing protein [Hymenobacter sp. GOD-10R]